MHYYLGLGLPFEWATFVIPKALGDKLMREFVIEKFQISETGLAAELSKVIADLVLKNTTQPASFRRSAAKGTEGFDRGEERFLNQILRDLRSSHAQESIPVKAVAMLLDPTLGIGTGGSSGFRAIGFGRFHLLRELTNRVTYREEYSATIRLSTGFLFSCKEILSSSNQCNVPRKIKRPEQLI